MRKRSRYRPKPVITNPVAYVLESMTPVTEHASYLVDLKIKNHLAAATLARGEASRGDLDALIAMDNITEALCRAGFGAAYRELLRNGHQALLAVCRRHRAAGHVALDEAELAALNDLMELHNQQMQVITIRDMERATALVFKEIAAGRAAVVKEKNT